MFINAMNDTLIKGEHNISITENGAAGYRTSGKSLVDLNFAVSSLRSANDDEIVIKFKKAFYEDPVLALKWLFFARDVREGLGERKLFRAVIHWIANNYKSTGIKLIPYIAEFGRFDDLLNLVDTSIKPEVIDYFKQILANDIGAMQDGKPCTLLAKWLPSENASSKKARNLAREIATAMKLTAKDYRKMLSSLRSYIGVLETQITANEWEKVDYEKVPSKANLKYNSAFLKHDEARRREYLAALSRGTVKINSSVNFPHDIVHSYTGGGYGLSTKPLDNALEALWKNLNKSPEMRNTLVVRDGSGSMQTPVGNTRVTALEVATALAIYFSETCCGEFKDRFVTFSNHPKLVDLSTCSTLKGRIDQAYTYSEALNTDIEAVFDLVLQTAIDHKMKQEDIPQRILILSDMEFDAAQRGIWGRPFNNFDERLFSIIKEKYARVGYKVPKLIFWNICGRTLTIPMRENELGVVLVSGFSPNIMSMLLSNKTDPFEILKEKLETSRYDFIEEVTEGESY